MSASDVLKFIKDKEVEFVDLRFTDPRGKLQHLTMDATAVDDVELSCAVYECVELVCRLSRDAVYCFPLKYLFARLLLHRR